MKDLKILLAEDDPVTAISIVASLAGEGYEVKAVSNGKEALAELEKNPDRYQVLITDLDMPLMSGADLIKKLRVFRFPLEIAVITGSLSHRLKEELSSYKIKNIFVKPLEPDDLLNYLADYRIPEPFIKPKAGKL